MLSVPNDPPVVLVIDDEPGVLRLLRLALSTSGFSVLTSSSAEAALPLLSTHHPDVVLLDLVMPGVSGMELLKAIKGNSDARVIVVSAKSSEEARVEALALGADDFVSKPFSPDRISESVNFLLAKERGELVSSVVVAGSVEIDLVQRRVTRAGEPVDLTRSEWRLIEELARSPSEPLLCQELLSRVWGADYRSDIAYLRLWIKRLRSKLGDSDTEPEVIVPYLDVGYVLNARIAER